MPTTIIRDRERDRDWESTSSRDGGRSYTVKRYKLPDRTLEEDVYESEMRLVRRHDHSPERERREVREYIVERDEPTPREVREYRFVERDRSPSPHRHEIREFRYEHEVERSPSPRGVREYRIEREY